MKRYPQFWTLRDQYLLENGGYEDQAAVAFARDLMQDNPDDFQRGYSRENAILAAQEIFPGAMVVDWEQEVPDGSV